MVNIVEINLHWRWFRTEQDSTKIDSELLQPTLATLQGDVVITKHGDTDYDVNTTVMIHSSDNNT